MKFFKRSHDGGPNSGVTGYWLCEGKKSFSIVLLHFQPGSRDAFHNHAFNALTIWLRGTVEEHRIFGAVPTTYKAGDFKWTPRKRFHKIIAGAAGAWCLSIRGPWLDGWMESRAGEETVLTHGRREVAR